MLDLSPSDRQRMARVASLAAKAASKLRKDPYASKYGPKALRCVLHRMSSARQRCSNPDNAAYISYGGRGIKFQFPSVRAAAEWILDNLGPSCDRTIDRIDIDQHYMPGNLRWATREEQARNKRAYKRAQRGERIRSLQELRPDLTYETLRSWIKQGTTDEEIIARRKYARSSI